jgi:hypothetical protein
VEIEDANCCAADRTPLHLRRGPEPDRGEPGASVDLDSHVRSGLPLSLLDRNLVPGNSLVGVGRLAEIEEKIKEDNEDRRTVQR